MEKININLIMKQFDTYVEKQLEKKDSQHQQQSETPTNQLDQYFQTMEKRLKLRTVANYQKFQNLLAPMKKLKSFVSTKSFLRQLTLKTAKTKQNVPSQQFQRKLQYQRLRGGYYMQKIQNHLKNNNLKRKIDSQAEMLLNELEANPTQRNQYTNWIENVLGKISLRQENFLHPQQSQQNKQNLPDDLQKGLATKKNTTAKQQFLRRKSIQDKEQKNFKKLGDFLSQRLRKILIDKYGSISNNKKNSNISTQYYQDQQNQSLASNSVLNKKTSRTAGFSKRMRLDTIGSKKRAQTCQLKTRNQNNWKDNFNCKINQILNQADIQVKKGKQQIAKLNLLRNKIYDQPQQSQI